MPLNYCIIEVYTSEEARWRGRPLAEAILDHVLKAQVAARCLVFKAVAGVYENGELASARLEVLSYNLPVKVEIVLPAAECERLLGELEPMVSDGLIAVREAQVRVHRVSQRLIARQLRVRDVMAAPVTRVTESTPVSDIIRLLLTAEFNAVPVVDGEERPVGIITQGDLIERAQMPIRLGLLAELEEAQLEGYLAGIAHLTAAQVMTAPVVTVEADKRVEQIIEKMLKRRLKRFPVVDEAGKLVGMLARLDIFGTIAQRATQTQALRACKVDVREVAVVGDIMSRERATVLPEASGAEVLELMRTQGVQRVVVVDAAGRLLGLITDADLLTAITDRRGGFWEYLSRRPDMLRAAQAKTAAEIMKTELLTVTEETPVEEAVRLMAEHGLKRLPVVDAEGQFAGMISRQAVLGAGASCGGQGAE